MTRRIWLVRHGNTFAPGETPRRIGSRTDLPLTAAGQVQAEHLARHFTDRGVAFDSAYSGPLCRAQQTALRILAGQNCSLQPMTVLQEIDHGVDEGLSEQTVRNRIGEAALTRWDRHAEAPAGWIVDPAARLEGWCRFFAEQARERKGDCLCVSSNGALRFALLALSQTDGLALPSSLKIRTGAMGLIEIGEARTSLRDWDVLPA